MTPDNITPTDWMLIRCVRTAVRASPSLRYTRDFTNTVLFLVNKYSQRVLFAAIDMLDAEDRLIQGVKV